MNPKKTKKWWNVWKCLLLYKRKLRDPRAIRIWVAISHSNMTPKNPHLYLVFIQFPLCLISLDIEHAYVNLPHRPNPRQISAFSPWLQLEPHQPSSSPTKLGIGPTPFYNKHGHRVHPAAVTHQAQLVGVDGIFFMRIFPLRFAGLGRIQWKLESKGHDMVETYRASTLRLRWNWSRLFWGEGCCFVTKDNI